MADGKAPQDSLRESDRRVPPYPYFDTRSRGPLARLPRDQTSHISLHPFPSPHSAPSPKISAFTAAPVRATRDLFMRLR